MNEACSRELYLVRKELINFTAVTYNTHFWKQLLHADLKELHELTLRLTTQFSTSGASSEPNMTGFSSSVITYNGTLLQERKRPPCSGVHCTLHALHHSSIFPSARKCDVQIHAGPGACTMPLLGNPAWWRRMERKFFNTSTYYYVLKHYM